MKKKIRIGGLKIKISWKNSRLAKSISNFFSGQGYTLRSYTLVHPEILRERKIYRLFKEKYCGFYPGNRSVVARPTSMIYYKGCADLGCERCFIGELMFEESKEDFFKRKNIIIHENIHEYQIKQEDLVLAKFDKEWVEAQGQYQ